MSLRLPRIIRCFTRRVGRGLSISLLAVGALAQSTHPTLTDDPALVPERAELTYDARPGELEAAFTFRLLNISRDPVVITDVKTSCGCTVAQLPARPWIIPAGKADELRLSFDLRGRTGLQTKTATIETGRGRRILTMHTRIPATTVPPPAADPSARERNQALAKTDRQAVFRGDCAGCHATPATGLLGEGLYRSACGICHEAEHRASFVPSLRDLARPADRDYWRSMVVAGKPGTLMPGFSGDMGGPLGRSQIDSLVDYLIATYARRN